MLWCVIVKIAILYSLKGMYKTAALERQVLSCTYLAHHALKSVLIITNTIIFIIGNKQLT